MGGTQRASLLMLQLLTFNGGRRGLIAGTELKWLFGKQTLVSRSLQGEEGLGKRGHRSWEQEPLRGVSNSPWDY